MTPCIVSASRVLAEKKARVKKNDRKGVKTIRQIRHKCLALLPGKILYYYYKVSNSREVKRSGHSDAIDDSCSVCTMSCESM